MPYSLIVNGYPTQDAFPASVQGPAVQGMFLHLLEQVDPAVAARLHAENRYRPYTLSPLGIGNPDIAFRGFQLPPETTLARHTPCYLRVTLLDDNLFPTFARYFLTRAEPTFQLGPVQFTVISIIANPDPRNIWSQAYSYPELIEQVRQSPLSHHITLHFITPLSFSKGDIDLPLPVPRLVFQSYLKRFQEFHDFPFLPDFVELVESYVGIARMTRMRTGTIKTKNVMLSGFTGEVRFDISKKAPKEFLFQATLLSEFAFFCGTGKKTTVGMGQTLKLH